MIKRVPLKRDPPGQCGRWRVIVYNKETKKFDWHTVRGTRADAKALERKFEDAKRKGEYTGPLERRTFEEVANLYLDDRRANNRRMSTLEEYQTELKIRLLPRPNEKLPLLGPRDIRNIKRADMKAHFNTLRNSGCTVSQVNKSIKAAKAIFTYAFDLEYGTSNIMQPGPESRCFMTKASSASTRVAMKRSVGTRPPSAKNMSSSKMPESGSSILSALCIAFEVRPILCPLTVRPAATFISTHAFWTA